MSQPRSPRWVCSTTFGINAILVYFVVEEWVVTQPRMLRNVQVHPIISRWYGRHSRIRKDQNMKWFIAILTVALFVFAGCGNDDEPEADRLGVGASCSNDDDCNTDDGHTCLGFKGGYCGVPDCMSDEDCPEASKCVDHTDGEAYCFRTCIDKSECNRNRSDEDAANCSSNITFKDEENGIKACVPPS